MPKLNLIDILKNTILEQAPVGLYSSDPSNKRQSIDVNTGKVSDVGVIDDGSFPGIPDKWLPLAKLIASKESKSYTSLYPGTNLESEGLDTPTTKTFKDIQDFLNQKGMSNNAVGRWQFKFLLDKVKGADLSENDLFNPINQNKIFMNLINNTRGVTTATLKSNLYDDAKKLAMEWEVLPVLENTTGDGGKQINRGDSYYGQKSPISADEFENVLKQISD